jgi:hypothetical protein
MIAADLGFGQDPAHDHDHWHQQQQGLPRVLGRLSGPVPVSNVTAEPTTVTAPMIVGHGPGSGDVRSATRRTQANRTTCSSAASFAPLNAASR